MKKKIKTREIIIGGPWLTSMYCPQLNAWRINGHSRNPYHSTHPGAWTDGGTEQFFFYKTIILQTKSKANPSREKVKKKLFLTSLMNKFNYFYKTYITLSYILIFNPKRKIFNNYYLWDNSPTSTNVVRKTSIGQSIDFIASR